ncbi:YlmC/YmxH family sporulation protein [Alteribacillus sp. HJP-4]|uniref:YlmC/YmxH family sporulation protein n=1 Tax=Alteribacillus sp. HJP-4 TaxID=2775394 RepID=UPI0035CD128D
MRLSEISRKEVLDVRLGERLGSPGTADLVFDETSGKIEAFIFPAAAVPFRKKQAKEWTIPWSDIRRVGEDYIIIDHP